VDLKQLREQGEEIYHLPVPDEEMRRVVGSIYENLPETGEERPHGMRPPLAETAGGEDRDP
jgi:hypothetical protein